MKNKKLLLLLFTFLFYIISCTPINKTEIIVESNKSDAEISLDGSIVGKGKTVLISFNNRVGALHRIVAKSQGQEDVVIELQPNHSITRETGWQIFIWTIGWVALEPLWMWMIDDYYYAPEEINPKHNCFVINVEFKKPGSSDLHDLKIVPINLKSNDINEYLHSKYGSIYKNWYPTRAIISDTIVSGTKTYNNLIFVFVKLKNVTNEIMIPFEIIND